MFRIRFWPLVVFGLYVFLRPVTVLGYEQVQPLSSLSGLEPIGYKYPSLSSSMGEELSVVINLELFGKLLQKLLMAENIEDEIESLPGNLTEDDEIFWVQKNRTAESGMPPVYTYMITPEMGDNNNVPAGNNQGNAAAEGQEANPAGNADHIVVDMSVFDGDGVPPVQNPEGGVGVPEDLEHLSRNVPLLRWLGAGGGDGGGDPDDAQTQSGMDDNDPVKKAFARLQEQAGKVWWVWLPTRLRLMRQLINFASQHKEYATRCYALLSRLVRYEALTYMFVVRVLYNAALSATFRDAGIIAARTSTASTSATISSVIPWLFDNHWIEPISLVGGTTAIAYSDNGFAQLSNSTYALKWQSEEFRNYFVLLFVNLWVNIRLLKNAYSLTLIAGCSRFFHRHQGILLGVDFAFKPILNYLVVATSLSAYYGFSVTTAPNPYGGYSFPKPGYCPNTPWIPWLLNCNATEIEARRLEAVPSER